MRVPKKRLAAAISVALIAGGLVWVDRNLDRYALQSGWWRDICQIYSDRLTGMYYDYTGIYLDLVGGTDFDALAQNPALRQQIDRHKTQYLAGIAPDALDREVDFFEHAQYSNCPMQEDLLAWVYLNGIGVPENRQKAESYMHLDVMDWFKGADRQVQLNDGPLSPDRLRSIGMLGFWYESAAWYDRVYAMTPEEIAIEGDRWVPINRNLGEMLHRWAVMRGSQIGSHSWELTPGPVVRLSPITPMPGHELGLRRTLDAILKEPWRYRPSVAQFYVDLAIHTDVATLEEVAEAQAYITRKLVRALPHGGDESDVRGYGSHAPFLSMHWYHVKGL